MPIGPMFFLFPTPAVSYDTLKAEPGRERIDILQITLERCTLVNGESPCAATSTCVNSWATCRSKANYTPEDFDVQFCTPASAVPDGMTPFLQSVRSDAGYPDPEDGLGKRASITATLIDAPHDDIGFDPYLSTRTTPAMQRGTFWPRFRARWPYYNGRPLKWYRGFVHEPFSLSNCVEMNYIATELKGWGRGQVQFVGKDPLVLADDDASQYPPRSTGLLSAALLAASTPTQIDIVTDRPTEYDIQSWEPSYSAVRIGDEVIKYTTVATITGGVRLSGLTLGGFDQYETERQDHDAGDEVQKCAYFQNMRPIDVFQVLLEDGAGIPTAYIPYAEWLSEATTWIAGYRITRLVCEPEGVKASLKELIPQTSTWALWWDEQASEIKYRVVRPPDLAEVVATLNDDQNIIAGSTKCLDDTDRLLNEVYVTLGQRNPVKKIDDAGNYRAGFITIDTDSQSDRQAGVRRTRTIWGRWQPTGNRAELQAIVDRVLLNRSEVPLRFELAVDRKDDDIMTGDYVDLTTFTAPDMLGESRTVRCRVLVSRNGDDELRIVAREDLFSADSVGSFARIAPNTFAAGTDYSTASANDKAYYMFIADDDGYLNGGDAGKVLL